MKTRLMFPDRDFDLGAPLPPLAEELIQDLEVEVIIRAMAGDDPFLAEAARAALLASLDDPAVIAYRLEILKDCIANARVIRTLYQIPVETFENKKKGWMGIFNRNPGGILYSAISLLDMFMSQLKRIKTIAEKEARNFHSPGFKAFFAMINQELDEAYFKTVATHLAALRFRDGTLVSAALGRGNEGQDYTLHRPGRKSESWLKRLVAKKSPSYSLAVDPRDDYSIRALMELRDRGIHKAAHVLGGSANHVEQFFRMLQGELAFYVGCLNLYELVQAAGRPVCFPSPLNGRQTRLSFTNLHDVPLVAMLKEQTVGNDLDADGKQLVIITGANQGGKSTFLRSIGVAQLMMQCGMFVTAERFEASICRGLFTHYKRGEDAAMKSGKLDEELSRVDQIARQVRPGGLVLFNESFSVTNEREGSEIARQIVRALVERGVRVLYVTHLHDFAHSQYLEGRPESLFLRAERQEDGTRSFLIQLGEPLETSFGRDLYQQIFARDK